MSVSNIIIPGGILATSYSPQSTGAQRERGSDEQFDIVEAAREQARALDLDTINEAPQPEPDPIAHPQRPPLPRLRSNSINLAGLARSRATGLSTPANPGLRLEPAITFQSPIDSSTNAVNPDDSFLLRPLADYQASRQDATLLSSAGALPSPDDDATRPVLPGRSSSRSIFGRSLSTRSRPKPNRGPASASRSARQPSHTTKLERATSRRSRRASTLADRRTSIIAANVLEKVKSNVVKPFRRSNLQETYEKAKVRQVQMRRSTLSQISFQYASYLLMLAGIYFTFVGLPLWSGLVLVIYNLFHRQLAIPVGTAVFLGIAFLYAYLPLLIPLEETPTEEGVQPSSISTEKGKASDTALLIPCYKSEKLIAATLEAALKVFPAENIFVIANGNSPSPLDNTAAMCEQYGVSHTWSPIGSKIVAQFVGCYVAKRFPYVLLIDDDCLLPSNFPIVTDRLHGRTRCIGYTIKSVGPNRSKGTLCQQAQDIEYKLSGLQRAFAGKIGSATFPHGAISIWDRELLIKTFEAHPGFSVSEDWFFGHVARQLGCRIQMCTAVFVETETPDSIFFSGGGDRGGFGEMTIWKQRFYRWNYFFVSGLFWDTSYIIRRWRLGGWELGAKLFVFQEVYETLLYLLAPFVLPISFIVRPKFTSYLFAATLVLYQINVLIFNYVHLRSRHESVSVLCLIYYLPYKAILTFVNIASCYYSIYKYAKYFAKRHPKIIEDEGALAVVIKLEEFEEEKVSSELEDDRANKPSSDDHVSDFDERRQAMFNKVCYQSRRFSITAVGTNLSSALAQQEDEISETDENDLADRPSLFPRYNSRSRSQRNRNRTLSKASGDLEVSPQAEREKPLFPSPSRAVLTNSRSKSNSESVPQHRMSPPERPSLASRIFNSFSFDRSLRRQSSNTSDSARSRSSSSPHHVTARPREQDAILSDTYSGGELQVPPQVYRPAALSRVDEMLEFDIERYVSALADTGSRATSRPASRPASSHGRLFIREAEEEEDQIAHESGTRTSLISQRSSLASRSRVSIG